MTGRAFVFFSPGRSGYHAVMTWIAHQIGGAWLHNHCYGVGSPEELSWDGSFGQSMHITSLAEPNDDNSAHRFYSVEQFDLVDYKTAGFQNFRELVARKSVTLIVLRDPFNYLASCIRKRQIQTRDPYWLDLKFAYIPTWLQYARECAGESDYLSDFVFISFNDWFRNRAYRQRLATILDISCTDRGLDFVPIFGSGSSFDRRRYNGKGRQMDVLGRWRYYAADPNYLRIFSDYPDLVHFSKLLFNFNPLEL